MIAREVYVIQRKQRNGSYADWVNPMNERLEYETHQHAAATLLRRANAVEFRIVRRVWTYTDFPVTTP